MFNVTNPTLTFFPADPAKVNGTAVVICPGGAFFALSIDSEGIDVARWLAAKGVTGFLLKYRLVECKTDDPTRELMARGKLDDIVAPIVRLAMADGNAAIGYVRKHAKEYGVNPDRIGVMGFSAGGTVTASVAFNYSADTRPDFVAPIYPAKKSAELHLYSKGRHGFGMRKQNLPTDHWIERFADWLEGQGFLKK